MNNHFTDPSPLLTADFDFILPPELIAAMPVEPRHAARLLHVKPHGLADHHVYDLPDLLRPDDLLVLNNTKVIPARLYGKRRDMKVELLLHRQTTPHNWLAFARPAKRLREGDIIQIAPDFAAEVLGKQGDGFVQIRFEIADDSFWLLLEKYGQIPLPPYIKRTKGSTEEDRTRYQTIYAEHKGAVAAPTAGLHFTPKLFAKLAAKGIESATVTLHVGAGTFLPVKAERLIDHVMHAEWGEISEAVAQQINAVKQAGRRIISVGTTPLRLLESATDQTGKVIPFRGETDIFIYPGYRWKCVDALMTNFHLPKSTLFMLASAFAGMQQMQAAYQYAIANNYRFYSYGDSSLLERADD